MKNTLLKALAIATMSTVFILSGCSDNNKEAPKITRIAGKTMGTFYGVIIPGGYKGGEEPLRKICEDSFNEISDVISTFDPNAELAKFNEHKSTAPFPISDALSQIIQECDYQSRRIDGVMDISVGPLVNLWGFGKDKSIHESPTDEEILQAKKLVGLDSYELRHTPKGAFLVKKDPNVRIDLSTVGEGMGADAVAEILSRQGVKNFFVNVAGASRSSGFNPKGQLWKIGIEDPTNPDHNVFVPVCPKGKAMSTAGSYRNYFKDDKTGHFYSHIIDPKTGRPVDHRTMSVTVIDDTATVTDALDTGLLVWGAEKALKWADKHNVAIYTIEDKDGKPVGRYSKAFAQYLKCDIK